MHVQAQATLAKIKYEKPQIFIYESKVDLKTPSLRKAHKTHPCCLTISYPDEKKYFLHTQNEDRDKKDIGDIADLVSPVYTMKTHSQ